MRMLGRKDEMGKSVEKKTVENQQAALQVTDAVHAGTCDMMRWRRGKEVTETEYAAAVEKFKNPVSAAGRSSNA